MAIVNRQPPLLCEWTCETFGKQVWIRHYCKRGYGIMVIEAEPEGVFAMGWDKFRKR